MGFKEHKRLLSTSRSVQNNPGESSDEDHKDSSKTNNPKVVGKRMPVIQRLMHDPLNRSFQPAHSADMSLTEPNASTQNGRRAHRHARPSRSLRFPTTRTQRRYVTHRTECKHAEREEGTPTCTRAWKATDPDHDVGYDNPALERQPSRPLRRKNLLRRSRHPPLYTSVRSQTTRLKGLATFRSGRRALYATILQCEPSATDSPKS
jgi:hypothetical protein